MKAHDENERSNDRDLWRQFS